jgi:hypothetical protein
MRSGKIITLTLAGVGLALTGCRRSTATGLHETEILPPGDLSRELRSSLPAYSPNQGGDDSLTPLNAYDPRLGYFHRPCNAWYPYPYGHHDPRWGYYRCGRWYRSHTHVTGYGGTSGSNVWNPGRPLSPTASNGDDLSGATSTAGAPTHKGISSTEAQSLRSSMTSRGGFGSTGRRSSFFSGS